MLFNSQFPKIDAHVVSIDRPGMGLSTLQPNRRILDWSSDVLALADHLSLSTFHILAISGGCPYALACAKEIPKARLLNTAIVSGAYPSVLGTEGMLLGIRALFFLAAWVPSFVGIMLDWDLGYAARDSDPKVLVDKFMKVMAARPEKDVRVLDNVEARDQIVEGMRPAFAQGRQGPEIDLKLVSSDWGFGLEEVDGRGMVLWHGGADVNTPFGMAEKAAKLVKGCELRAFEEETHMSMPYNHFDEILKRLLEVDA